MGWRKILVANILCFRFDADFQCFCRSFHPDCVRRFLRLQQPLVIFLRELGVHGQIYRSRITPPRQHNSELHTLTAPRLRRHIGFQLARRQNLLQQDPQLYFSPHASSLHVGQHFFQVAYTSRQRLHLAQPFVHLFQTITDHLERFAESFLQCGMQLFIDGLPHGLQLAAVILLQRSDLHLHCFPHAFELLLVGLRQMLQLFCKSLQLRELIPGILIQPPHDSFIILMKLCGHFFPNGALSRQSLCSRAIAFFPYQPLQALTALPSTATDPQHYEQYDHQTIQ